MQAGADEIYCSAVGGEVPSLTAVAYLLKLRGDSMGLSSSVDQTAVAHTAKRISDKLAAKESGSVLRSAATEESNEFTLSSEDDCNTVAEYIRKLGYVLSDEDLRTVYDSFCRLASKKPIGARELEAIIATSAMQVIPTYVVKSYLANSGNTISSTAHVVMEKNGTEYHGISVGDGPIDAAFRAIEQVTGHHFELDDFQIRAITEGREAMGEAVVKLRADGKLFSGCGVSTDIIGASIHAYVNALNKICHEEAERA
jgi:2-isopropylmalate synthase